MGNLFTRKNKNDDKLQKKDSVQNSKKTLSPNEILEQKALEALKYQMEHSPEEFVLNQLLASFQFFANFERLKFFSK